ncbi:MAG: hypothetical protein AVDCRST_MAG93-1290 [uncultured Chloroflexia bacterium]|uniref:Uncharacterized protein n=1 Tax=uncultured Chloroflexia bacterium TaxID=1672391 RepID=A0A6J4I4E3_9CHLR|nr:MAG: hypothetical protein AVDCRST_MAG93-1290 [uncultured Chloroflexia bacterium]
MRPTPEACRPGRGPYPSAGSAAHLVGATGNRLTTICANVGEPRRILVSRMLLFCRFSDISDESERTSVPPPPPLNGITSAPYFRGDFALSA